MVLSNVRYRLIESHSGKPCLEFANLAISRPLDKPSHGLVHVLTSWGHPGQTKWRVDWMVIERIQRYPGKNAPSPFRMMKSNFDMLGKHHSFIVFDSYIIKNSHITMRF